MPRRPSFARDPQSWLAAVGAYFGIRQATLAAYLGISQPMVSLADRNHRQLSAQALLRLLPLVQLVPVPHGNGPVEPLADLPPPPAALPPLLETPAPGLLRDRLTACELALWRATRALERAERPAAQARRLLAVLPAMVATLPPNDARAHRQLPLLEAEAHYQLGLTLAAARALLTIRVAALRHEIAWLTEWLPRS